MKRVITLFITMALFFGTNCILVEAGGESETAGKKVSLTVWLGVSNLVPADYRAQSALNHSLKMAINAIASKMQLRDKVYQG